MESILWAFLTWLGAGVIITMIWATVRWFKNPGSGWIASFFGARSGGADGGDARR